MSWKSVALGDVVRLQNGFAFKSSEYAEIGYFLMRITNVQQGFISNHNPKYVSIPNDSKLVQFIVNDGDILMSLTGDVGRVGVVKSENLPAALNQRVARIQIKSRDLLDEKFLFYLLNSDLFREKIEDLGHGAAQLNVATSDIAKLLIPLPSIATQQNIVEKLDAIFAEIDRATVITEANIKNANALFQSYLSDVFEKSGKDWESVKVSDLGSAKSGGTPSVSNKEYWGGEIEWYSSGELNDFYTKPSIKKISDLGLKNSNAKIFPPDSLLIGMYDTAAMKMSLLSNSGTFNQAIAGIMPNEKINTKFIYFAFTHIKPYVLSLRQGVRQKNLSLDKIKNLSIKLPNLREQAIVVDRLIEVRNISDSIIKSREESMKNILSLKQSILRQAFNGELVKE